MALSRAGRSRRRIPLALQHDCVYNACIRLQEKSPNLDIETQVELAKHHCLMEYCAVNCMPMFHSVSADQMKEAIDAVGPDRAIIATDSGQPFSPKTPDMFRMFAQVLHEKGIALHAIATMAIHNPASLLGLRPRNDAVKLMPELFGVAQEETGTMSTHIL